MPEQNVPPAPVRMPTRSSGSSSISTHASYMRTSISPDSAFLAAGRFIVTMATWPSRSKRRCGSSEGWSLTAGECTVGTETCSISEGVMELSEVDLYDADNFVDGVPHEMFATLRREAP